MIVVSLVCLLVNQVTISLVEMLGIQLCAFDMCVYIYIYTHIYIHRYMYIYTSNIYIYIHTYTGILYTYTLLKMVSPYLSPVLSFLLVLSYVLSLVTDESSVRHHVSVIFSQPEGVGRWHWHVLLSGFRSVYLWLQAPWSVSRWCQIPNQARTW